MIGASGTASVVIAALALVACAGGDDVAADRDAPPVTADAAADTDVDATAETTTAPTTAEGSTTTEVTSTSVASDPGLASEPADGEGPDDDTPTPGTTGGETVADPPQPASESEAAGPGSAPGVTTTVPPPSTTTAVVTTTEAPAEPLLSTAEIESLESEIDELDQLLTELEIEIDQN